MSGLVASMIAGGVKNVADTRLHDMEQQEQFDMQKALMDAQAEKNLRLKEAGYQMDQEHDQAERKRVQDVLQAGRDKLNPQESEPGGYDPNAPKKYEDMSEYDKLLYDANTLKENGDLEGYDKMIARAKNVKPEKETLKDFDPTHIVMDNSGRIVYNGSQNKTSFKNEDDIWAASQDPTDPRHDIATKIIDAKGKEKVRVAKASRAPEKQSDDDLAYADWKKKPENKDKGRDDWAREKATFGKDNDSESVTEKRDADGELIETSRTTKGKPKPKAPGKPWERNW